jgi:hypothetical protein
MARAPRNNSRKGIPNKSSLMGRELAAEWGPDAIRKLATLAGLVKDAAGNPVGAAQSEEVQRSSCVTLIERAYGKAPQPLVGGEEDDEPIRQVLRVEFVNAPPKIG